MESTNVNGQKTYPLLTWEVLARLEQRVKRMKTTAADCEFIDHYLTSIGYAGYLQKLLREDGVFSFEDIADSLIETDKDSLANIDLKPAGITGSLLGCIHGLMDCVRDGQKIY